MRRHVGNPPRVPIITYFYCDRGNAIPTTPDNAARTTRFRRRDAGTRRCCDRFPRKCKELIMTTTRQTARKPAARKGPRRRTTKRWSQRGTRESDALDLKRGVFKLTSARKIATSLKRSAENSSRRKANAYRSALSMLTFYINRAGKSLPKTERARLERAKGELKRQFGRE